MLQPEAELVLQMTVEDAGFLRVKVANAPIGEHGLGEATWRRIPSAEVFGNLLLGDGAVAVHAFDFVEVVLGQPS